MPISLTDQEPSRPPREYMTIAVVTGLLPWLGVVARLLTANPSALLGYFSGLQGSASLYYLHLPPEVAGKRSFGVSLLVWTFVFVPVFASTAWATGMIIRR
jgi:hypothetical protein